MTSLEDSPVTYEQLADIEREFEEVETEILRQQYEMTRPLYEKRAGLIKQIPNFWALVMEAAPPEIDEHIQPLDSAVLLSSLVSISVRRFSIDDGGKGDPRDVAIRFEFTENEYFEDKVLEKKFWYRYSDDYTGLVSEPVEIRWKEGKDLTDGLLAAVKKVWDDGDGPQPKKTAGKDGKKEKAPLTASQQALKEKMESMSLGGVSFFAWFGFIGARISAEESKANLAKERETIKLRLEGKEVPKEDGEGEDDDDDDDDDDDFDDLEIFPEGDDVAQAIVLDLWPDALKYFTQAQEQEQLASEMEIESDEDEKEGDDERPSKKQKA